MRVEWAKCTKPAILALIEPSRSKFFRLRILADRSEWRDRFEREAKTVASLNHPHICVLFDTGHQATYHFLVMEYLEGETLAQRLWPTGIYAKQRHPPNGAWTCFAHQRTVCAATWNPSCIAADASWLLKVACPPSCREKRSPLRPTIWI